MCFGPMVSTNRTPAAVAELTPQQAFGQVLRQIRKQCGFTQESSAL